MERQLEEAASSSSKYLNISKQEFEDLINVSRNDRYEIIYFILNTLNFILHGDKWYCYCTEIKNEKDGVLSSPHHLSGHCQICKVPDMFLILNEISIKTGLICRY